MDDEHTRNAIPSGKRSAGDPPARPGIGAAERARRRGHRGGVFWMTGRPGAGKSTLALAVERVLFEEGFDVAILDGDALRTGLNADLGFTEGDRAENVRRTAAVARLLAEHGIAVLVALISPYRAQRGRAAEIAGGFFHEVYVEAEVATCERRDPKGHYAAARAGRLRNFTGVDAPYEPPDAPALRIRTEHVTVAEAAGHLAAFVRSHTATRPDAALRDGNAAAMADPLSRE